MRDFPFMAVIEIVSNLYGSFSLFQVHVRCRLSICEKGRQRGLEGDQPRDLNGECANVFNQLAVCLCTPTVCSHIHLVFN